MAFEYESENFRLEIDKDAPIARLFINRPDKLNAITMKMRAEIVRFFDMIEEDERIRVVVLRGFSSGKGFSAGGDILAGGQRFPLVRAALRAAARARLAISIPGTKSRTISEMTKATASGSCLSPTDG